MKIILKDLENLYISWISWIKTKPTMVWTVLIIILFCITLNFNVRNQLDSYSCNQTPSFTVDRSSYFPTPLIPSPPPLSSFLTQKIPSPPPPTPLTIMPETIAQASQKPPSKTNLSHIVFGIAASTKLWDHRKNYVKQWWRPGEMRGVVWFDEEPKTSAEDERVLPPWNISGDTSKFKYSHPTGHHSAIRISRIVSETFRMERKKEVRWFVLGDDDTVFVADNLVRVLQKYDHKQFYYIGSSSESHVQNIAFSYNMAFGGGGIAISYPLAKELEKMQDRCIQRYPTFYGSDDRLQACMAELGVPLTKERGFHQFDVYGNLFGLLSAHPVTPLVSLHHLDLLKPIFPNMDRIESLKRLKGPIGLDSAALMQQSICYDKRRRWTVSVSWGFAVQIVRGFLKARDMEVPTRTTLNWYRNSDKNGYTFNTRPLFEHKCQKPFVYYVSGARFNSNTAKTVTEYVLDRVQNSKCEWKTANPYRIQKIEVHKRPDPDLWDKSPRRNCCRILSTKKKNTMFIEVGVCKAGEVAEVR